MAQFSKQMGGWHYDRIVNHEIDQLRQVQDKEEEVIKKRKQTEMDLEQLLKFLGTRQKEPRFKEQIGKIKAEIDFLKASQEFISKGAETITFTTYVITEAKPIMIGPATLDTLVNYEPKTYEYIEKEHLPFDIMFFEFPEPYQIGIPFSSDQGNLTGLLFYKIGGKTGEYTAFMYFEDSARAIQTIRMKFNPKTKAFFEGHTDLKNVSIKFSIDAATKQVEYSTAEDMVAYYRSRFAGPKAPDATRRCKFEEVENGDVLLQISNLCTNIVNYINAQNTTITKRTRTIDVLSRTDKGKKKKEKRDLPYYIVRIQKREIEESEIPTGNHWTLDERIVVRGHDRRYKDESGKIYLTTWIEPYVKGPEDAPWRNQRYQMMGEAIEREKRMMQ